MSKKVDFGKIAVVVWISAMALFVIMVILNITMRDLFYSSKYIGLIDGLFFGDIAVGIIAFIAMIIILFASFRSPMRNKAEKEMNKQFSSERKAFMGYNPWFVVSIFLLIVMAYQYGKMGNLFLGQRISTSLTPTAALMNCLMNNGQLVNTTYEKCIEMRKNGPGDNTVPSIPTGQTINSNSNSNSNSSKKVNCIGPDGKILVVTAQECENFNKSWGRKADYANGTTVDCKLAHLPSRKMSIEDCKRGGECQLGPNNYVWMDDISKCSSGQSSSSDSCGNKVSYTTTQASVNGTFYCCSNRVNEIARLEQELKMTGAVSDTCTSSAQTEAYSCTNQSCNTLSDPNAYADCSKLCFDQAYAKCNSQSSGEGVKRQQLNSLIREICP